MRFRACVIAMMAVIATGSAARAEVRLSLDGWVDGKPTRFMLDTGLSYSLAAFPDGAARLGLTVAEPPPSGDSASVLMRGLSSARRILISKSSPEAQGVFVLFKSAPEGLVPGRDFDAMIGWATIEANVLYYAPGRGVARFDRAIPMDLSAGQAFRLIDSNVAVLDAGAPASPLPVMIDTGSNAGVQLSSALWIAWLKAHPEQPMTLHSSYSPATEAIVTPQAFASVLRLGRLTLRNVLVSELPASRHYGAVPPEAIIGLDVFANQDLYLDGPGKTVVLLPPERPTPVVYNRLGAAFTPPGFVARVATASPASRAGILDGDVLVRLDGLAPEAYAARVDAPSVWMQPSGTTIALTLRRGQTLIERQVVLEDFLGQASP
ncbi:PDZ domain-containing protein [Caulobacter segnis]|uniref:PDZ domain-containing protein n=1 Tax=Caulobacter segnis TaxID=88688 RepID=UPI001CBB8DF2|nr:PDZ domain-containing protein [Caulobacter segnis]UAL10614.1 hypothetical protein K8940_23180 [Caulobacter segnis]